MVFYLASKSNGRDYTTFEKHTQPSLQCVPTGKKRERYSKSICPVGKSHVSLWTNACTGLPSPVGKTLLVFQECLLYARICGICVDLKVQDSRKYSGTSIKATTK